MTTLDFVLPAELEAHEPPEARGVPRDGVRLLVGRASGGQVDHHRFNELPALLRPGDVLVVNTSATLPAAVPIPGGDLLAHFSTELADGRWLVELRRATRDANERYDGGAAGAPGGPAGRGPPRPGAAAVTLDEAYSEGRLWVASVDPGEPGSVRAVLRWHGGPIRYRHVARPWPLRYYQTVFATQPGSAEMPSAGRPFTDRLVTRLVSAGVLIVPIVLHTGVASAEAHERPYPEWFSVPPSTARTVASAKADGGRVIAVGTTVVRALESAVRGDGTLAAGSGWTDLVVTPERGVRAVDGLLTGLHEPRASHLDLLAAAVGRPLLERCYDEAVVGGYLWHEFGDLNLLLRD
jgi:S-adenosylmethionine:tRNA ribosyltransferase-isomerase